MLSAWPTQRFVAHGLSIPVPKFSEQEASFVEEGWQARDHLEGFFLVIRVARARAAPTSRSQTVLRTAPADDAGRC